MATADEERPEERSAPNVIQHAIARARMPVVYTGTHDGQHVRLVVQRDERGALLVGESLADAPCEACGTVEVAGTFHYPYNDPSAALADAAELAEELRLEGPDDLSQ